ncbi:MAG: YCF48-related protein [Gallionellaceae bacterium]
MKAKKSCALREWHRNVHAGDDNIVNYSFIDYTASRWQSILLLLGVTFLAACSGGGSNGSAAPSSPSWQKVDLPVNLIESVAVSPINRLVVYAGQRNSNPLVNAEHAVWRSDDGGETFNVVAKGVSFHLYPSPTDPDLVIGTVSEPDNYGNGSTQAIYVSRDRGQNWKPAFADGQGILLDDFNPGRGIGQHPQQLDTIYAVGRIRNSLAGAVFKSTDGGASWMDISPQGIALTPDPGFFVFDPLHADTVFLSANYSAADGSAGVLLKTVDGGKSWQSADSGLLLTSSEGSMTHYLNEIAVTTVTGVLVGVSNFGQLWINSDGGGGTWRPLPLPLGSVDQFLWSSQLPTTLVVINLDGTMLRSDDLGNNWQPVATPGTIVASTLDDSVPLGILITTANDNALYRTVDAGQTWTLLPKPPFTVSYYLGDGSARTQVSVIVSTQDRMIAFQGSNSYGSLPQFEVLSGGKWQIPSGMENFRSTVAVSSLAAFGNRMAAAAGGALFQQDLNGNWSRVSLPDGDWSYGSRLSSDSEQWGIYGGPVFGVAGFGGEVYLGSLFQGTTDGGITWTTNNNAYGYGGEAVFDTPNGRFWSLSTTDIFTWYVSLVGADGSVSNTSAGLPAGTLNALANSPQSPSRLYVGTSQGLYRSTDGGASWSPAFSDNSGLPVSTIAVDPTDSMTVWVLGTTGLVRSNDGGDHWTSVTVPDPLIPGASTFALHPSRSGVVVVSAASGLWISSDAGVSWQNVGGPTQGIRQIIIIDNAINVATDAGLFKCASLCQPL